MAFDYKGSFRPLTVNKDGQHKSSPEVKPKQLECPLVAGINISHTLLRVYVSRWDSLVLIISVNFMIDN